MEQEQIIEGPYWDYTEVSNYAARERDMWARIACKALLDGEIELAVKIAGKYAEYQALSGRLNARFRATDQLDLRFIGWRSSLDVRY